MWICHLLQMFRCFTPRNIYVHLFSELKGDEVHPEIKISHHHVQLLVPLHLWSGLSGDDLPALSWSSALSDLQSWAVAESTIQVHVWAQSIIAGVVWHQPVISDDRRQIEHDKIISLVSPALSFWDKHLPTFHSSTVFFTLGSVSKLQAFYYSLISSINNLQLGI